MTRTRAFAAFATVAFFLAIPSSLMAKKNVADYKLRLRVLGSNWSHNSYGYHGYGRGDLFDEQGVPHGVEYTYDCEDHLMGSSGDEAYPAKWKKQDLSLEVIFGEIGANPNSLHACEFKVAEKPFVFYRHNGAIDTESAQEYMKNHPNGPSADIPVSATPSHSF